MAHSFPRVAGLLLIAGLATGCSTQTPELAGAARPAINPLEQFKPQAEQTPDQVALALHAEGLSARQRTALDDYAHRYLDLGGQTLAVKAPANGGEPALRMADAVKAELQARGVPAAEIVLDPYKADKPDAPVLVVYQRWTAKPIACGRSWPNLMAQNENEVQSNFGCATTANMAAQIADPRDIAAPHASDPADAGRRSKVIDNYRKGDLTATKSDKDAKGNVSDAVQ